MEITKKPILIEDSIVFQDEDGIFIYSQNQKRVSWVRNWNDAIFQKLKEKNFFSPLAKTITNPENRLFSNLMLLLGRGCPLKCRYCYANAGVTRELMSKEVADQAISLYLARNPKNPKVTLFAGGEPTLNIGTIKYIVEKYEKQIRWVLTTCGVLSPIFLEWLIDKGVAITFSVDGPPEVQNFLRPLRNGKPSSAFVERSIRIWLDKSGKPLSVRATLTEDTIDQINIILDYFHSMGAETIHFEALYNLGRATQLVGDGILKQVAAEKWVETTIKVLKWARENKKHIKIGGLSHILRPSAASYCGPMCGKAIVVNHEGKLTACSEVVDEKDEEWNLFCIGDCQSGFRLNEEKLNYLASRIPDNMKFCQNCFARYLCRGGCPHKSWAATKDLFVPDINHCKFIKAILPSLIKEMAMRNN